MPHLEPDRLVLLALGEDPRDVSMTEHLLDCEMCRRELDDLRTVAGVGRRTQDLRELPPPPPRVWSAIAQATAGTPRRAGGGPVLRDWRTTAVVALAAALVAAGGTMVALWAARPGPAACTHGEVALTTLPGAPAGPRGNACLVTADGERKVRVHETGLPVPTGGDYEVWLLDSTSLHDPKGLRMTALGGLGSEAGEDFTVPANTDLSRYDVVDISLERNDGNPAHSGDSLLRGVLPRS